ncbi:MAG: TIGR01440 family protein [Sporomusaceae bacterium]|nr:TIGR01440 family protein [Sporomusaceae bacterium]
MSQKEWLEEIRQATREAATELLMKAQVKAGMVLVVGCSTSEVKGEKIGSAGSEAVAEILLAELRQAAVRRQVFLAIQCCEHLNRALVVEREAQERYGWTEVSVLPRPHAGGALAAQAMTDFSDPVVVETIQAHVGLDIGCTLIGMHLKAVAVPLRLTQKTIGQALLVAAKTRPKLIGGQRAVYHEEVLVK